MKKYQLNIITPLINQCIWKLPLEGRAQFVSLVLGYSTYLNLKYVAIKLTEEDHDSILATITHHTVVV